MRALGKDLSRRSLLAAAAMFAAGCSSATGTRPVRGSSRPVTGAPALDGTPDGPAVAAALAVERQLVDGYAAATTAAPARDRAALRASQARHTAHLVALQALDPTASTTAGPVRGVPALRRVQRHSASVLRDAARAATDGSVAAVLASVAASHTAASS